MIHSLGESLGIAMRGADGRTGSLFSFVDLEARVRSDHPLRPIRAVANAALEDLGSDFAALYPQRLGRPSIPPERLLRAMLLQAFYGSARFIRLAVGTVQIFSHWPRSRTKNRPPVPSPRFRFGAVSGIFWASIV